MHCTTICSNHMYKFVVCTGTAEYPTSTLAFDHSTFSMSSVKGQENLDCFFALFGRGQRGHKISSAKPEETTPEFTVASNTVNDRLI